MPAKGLLPFTVATALALANAGASAQDRARDTFFGAFDLKSAVLSPTPLGPPSQFEPPQVAKQQAATPDVKLQQVERPRSAAASPKAKPRPKIATPARKPKSNPLDAYARDPRRQTWPCVGDGICTWTQPR